ncbi:TPA: hypothetical protein DIC40_00185 [Patescibacteria group bacterium]|nr:hypothetical protein [Candidatus Gracilibacteria bacterium]
MKNKMRTMRSTLSFTKTYFLRGFTWRNEEINASRLERENRKIIDFFSKVNPYNKNNQKNKK